MPEQNEWEACDKEEELQQWVKLTMNSLLSAMKRFSRRKGTESLHLEGIFHLKICLCVDEKPNKILSKDKIK